MEFGISLYDALVSANVPPDKAKTLVQALEKEMFDRLATKQDLQFHLQAVKHDLTLRLGAMMVAGFGAIMALLKLLLH